jgi:thiol-disulfide isomerase/thioredoxin
LSVRPQATAFDSWKLQPAAEPKFAEADGEGGDSSGGPGTGSPLVGTEAAKFEAVSLGDVKGFKLQDQLGKTIVIDFWATWCPPCVKGLPELVELLDAYPRQQVVLVTVNMQESTNTVQEFLDARELRIKVLMDPNGDISRKFQVESIPQTVVVGPDGRIQRLYVGQSSKMKDDLKSLLDQLAK